MHARLLVIALTFAALSGCQYRMLPTGGGGSKSRPADESKPGGRAIVPEDVAIPPGYHVEAIASGLDFPVAVAFDDQSRLWVLEAGYAYGEVFTEARLVRRSDQRRCACISWVLLLRARSTLC